MIRRVSSFALVPALFVAASCRTTAPEDYSDVKFIANWSPASCIVSKVDKPALKMCITGNGNRKNAEAKTTESLNQWLAPLQARYKNIATEITFGCDNPDGYVNVNAGNGTGFAGPGRILQIYDSSALGTWLHEFGHAFACLGDTYVGGAAGACMGGQPKSIMCWGLLLKNITEDDVNGLLAQYVKLAKPTALTDPEGDEDGDEVLNKVDLCPNTKAGSDVWHDEQDGKWMGCAFGQSVVPLPKPVDPNADDDKDGVLNPVDKCPSTPTGAKVWVDEQNGKWRGCAGGQTPTLT